MNIEIYYLTGTKKTDWAQIPIEKYLSRFPNFWKVNMKPVYTCHQKSLTSFEILEKEKKQLEVFLDPAHCLIALDRSGQSFDTLTFAKKIEQLSNHYPVITFVIGSAVGLSNHLLKKVHHVWSLSMLTFPHILARLFLVEQIYRSYALMSQHPYHK